MGPDYVVNYLLQKTGRKGELSPVKWKEYHTDSGFGFSTTGYIASRNGIDIYLENGFSRAGSALYLTFRKGKKICTIVEPTIHISYAPIGKILRGLMEHFDIHWPRGPDTPEALEKERLRVALNNLYSRLTDQHLEMVKAQVTPTAIIVDEQAAQELFLELTSA